MTLWMVRSGRYGEREEFALENKVAVIGWNELPDLSKIETREQLRALLEKTFPDDKPKTHINWESQIWPFLHGMETGDLIAMPLKGRSAIAFGKITGPYSYRKDFPENARHTRKVDWTKEIPRDKFDQDLLHSFGAFMTVCRIHRNNAEERIQALIEGKIPPAKRKTDDFKSAIADVVEGEVSLVFDIEEMATDQIRDLISRKFRGHELTRLVGAILEAQGYTINIAKPGADGGVDIIAGKGPLGFDHPRLAVQVKSSDSPCDVKIVRELQGVMKNFQAEHGLLVSWGGYSGAVPKETSTKFFEIRLWNADDLIQMIQTHFDKMPDEIKADLPLKRIWIVVPEED
ncbi:MAG: restriction endonuclease [Methanomicrobiales archaeon HGW-Methanomicrobiales-3]|jgi:restriction system protein|nr:MAG: restriction endonuclease [Methanomicrobiales archaeon HGW-Methanomicrobiales-3]